MTNLVITIKPYTRYKMQGIFIQEMQQNIVNLLWFFCTNLKENILEFFLCLQVECWNSLDGKTVELSSWVQGSDSTQIANNAGVLNPQKLF